MNENAAPAGRRPARRLPVLALVCAAVVLTAGTATTVALADRSAPSPAWEFTDTPEEPGKRSEGLVALLVPYDEDSGYFPGPADPSFGHDIALDGDEMAERLRTTGHGSSVPHQDVVAQRGPRAMALRSYSHGSAEEGNVTTVLLMRMRNEAHAEATARRVNARISSEDGTSPAPSPPEHRDVRCHRTPPPTTTPEQRPERGRVDQWQCVAPVRDVLLKADVYAAGPLRPDHLHLVSEHLDRLTRRGESA
ncbi:hypothetical protein ACWD6I_01225 [Streptomyces sp. NPDC002454]